MTDNKSYLYGKTSFVIDLSKWNKETINLCTTIDHTYDNEEFLDYLKKAIRNIVKVYYPHNIVVTEPNVCKGRGNLPRIDLTVKLDEPMTTIEKRKLINDPYDKVTKMCTDIDSQIDKICRDFEAEYTNRPKCGYRTVYNRDFEKSDRGSINQEDDYYDE